jgi:coenzyme F420-0:L-glutamate ligase / coenzyme F420-1:gamma-L-glutamate ligase
MDGPKGLSVTPLRGLPLFTPGMDVAGAIAVAAERQGEPVGPDDVVVIAQKIVSKAEGRMVRLEDVRPGAAADELAQTSGRPAALTQLILDESSTILRAAPAAIIARHHTGQVLANAGIDASNVEGGDKGYVLLWPRDPDASARAIRAGFGHARPAVVIADSMGRTWRVGTVGTAIGCAGLAVLDDKRGEADMFGRILQATVIAIADAVAAAAVLVMGEGAEATPAAIVRGADRWISADNGPGMAIGLRPLDQDMFQ